MDGLEKRPHVVTGNTPNTPSERDLVSKKLKFTRGKTCQMNVGFSRKGKPCAKGILFISLASDLFIF